VRASPRRQRPVPAPVLGVLVALTGYLALLLTPGTTDRVPLQLLRDAVLGNLLPLLIVVVLVRRASAHPQERSWTLCLAVGTTWYLLGNLYYSCWALRHPVGFPSPADVGYLGMYPCLLTALLLALRHQLRGVRVIVALDGMCGMLAGGAVATWATAPLVDRIWHGSGDTALTLAYPLGAGLVVAAALGVLGIVGAGNGRHFLPWVLGMVLIGACDIVHAYLASAIGYHIGGPLEGLRAVGLTLVCLGATRARRSQPRALPTTRSLAVVAFAAVTAIAVLAGAPGWSTNPLPSVLSLATLALCAVRLFRAFMQLRELAAMRQQALTDELTGAANRRSLYAELDRLLPAPGAEETAGLPSFGLALIDLDHFKEVNDSYGHAAGDELLRVVVDRFAEALVHLQTPHLLARLGGDEFAVVFPDAGSRDAVMACGSALQESLLEPVVIEDVVLHAQASIGVAVAPDHGRNRGDMLFAADAAMYESKTSGEPVCFYSPSEAGDRRKRLEVAEDLFAALERGELTVEYQPVLAATGALVGAEALVRWDHPTRGRLSPVEFLEVAERYRLTPSIAARVLEVALADLARWRTAGTALRMSVNVSASDLRDDVHQPLVAEALLAHAIPPSALTIEITETAMMRDPEMARTVMLALNDLGVQLAVDDYGTGYSSLEYLLRLPIDEIKLDRAFFVALAAESRSVAIVRSTIDLTHALGLRMVAEGVEDEPTLDILRSLGCDLVQGWHLGRPMPAAAFESFSAVGVLDSRVSARHRRSTELSP
jgi:diguanylate cyclase (GGDEF)-like protein